MKQVPPTDRIRSRAWLPALLLAVAPAAAGAQEADAPDQVFVLNERTGAVKAVAGDLVEDKLGGVVVETSEGRKSFDARLVVRVAFGAPPPAFSDGQTYLDRGQFEDAAAWFKLAAADASAEPLVQAQARLSGAEALMKLGASDPAHFAEARERAGRFLEENPEHRLAPRATALRARALWLDGDAAGAAAVYDTLYGKITAGEAAKGHDLLACYDAGFRAAETALAAGDTLRAREIYNTLRTNLTASLAAARAEGDVERTRALEAFEQMTELGDGLVHLASGNLDQARSFFTRLVDGSGDKSSALRFGAHLGLAHALQGLGEHRAAQLEYARVAALDHTRRDNAAAALLGMAECAAELPESSGSTGAAQARTWLQSILDQYGDTPSARRARELLLQ